MFKCPSPPCLREIFKKKQFHFQSYLYFVLLTNEADVNFRLDEDDLHVDKHPNRFHQNFDIVQQQLHQWSTLN
ncbi:hypothetical protein DERP_007077 [Dermatophagoides pteronyssinus]|uniref:Uncharacterized protein n=1 Tax=Dermatophagoides pteronyssinus TaxID=6956 RepID=A0ABQ8JU88_DERPT|nr:hypothetical protein DERP_007077 [Dermatophagoides pteronyssinus]